jgi:PhzF family phenazine biosynthesis protein
LPLELVQVDAFTDRPFGGNPAMVCLLDEPGNEAWMQTLAAEMNLSETAFLVTSGDGTTNRWGLRWFTPTVEVELCGHATLAAAHFLRSHHGIEGPMQFDTRSGLLTAVEADEGLIEMDFPADPTGTVEPPDGLLDALGVTEGLVEVSRGRSIHVVELASADQVRQIRPDFAALADVAASGVTVTAAGEGLYDVISRYFAPWAGIDEDPVTGSAHCTLASYWAPRLGKDAILAHQASQRGGTVRVALRDGRVALAGKAVTVMTATLDPAALSR